MIESSYTEPDPTDPPMVEVLIGGEWYDGHVRAQWRHDDGTWRISVQHRRPGGGQGLGTFPADRVRPDQTDYSRGRGA